MVLVAGGASAILLLRYAGAELYDPVTGNWTVTGILGTARYYHTATLLLNGKVLVAGGANSGDYLTSAELYDPATGIWTAIGSLGNERYLSHGDLLLNGKVLVAGGLGIGGYLVSARTLLSGHRDLDRHRQPRHRMLCPHGDVADQRQGARRRRFLRPHVASVELFDVGLAFMRPDWHPHIARRLSLL